MIITIDFSSPAFWAWVHVSIAILFVGIMFNDLRREPYQAKIKLIAIASIWPVLFVALGLSEIIGNTTEEARKQLRNRKLLKEFERWFQERERKGEEL